MIYEPNLRCPPFPDFSGPPALGDPVPPRRGARHCRPAHLREAIGYRRLVRKPQVRCPRAGRQN